MKIASLLSFLSLIVFTSHAQKVSQKNVNIPGTRVFMNIPEGFKVSENFIGLMKDDYTGIQVLDLPDGNYYSNTRNFNVQEFISKGASNVELKDTIVSGYNAKMLVMLDQYKTSKLIQLVFGDSTFSAMIMGSVLFGDTHSENLVRKSILSVSYDKEFKVDPIATATFTFDDSRCLFKFAKANSSNYIFSIDGLVKESYEDEPFFMITSGPSSPKVSVKAMSLNLIQNFKNQGYKLTLDEDSFNPVNGCKAYEVVYTGTSNEGDSLKIYILTLKNTKQMVYAVSMIDRDIDHLLSECKRLSRTLRIK